MPKRFQLPTISRRRFSMVLSILVLVLAVGYVAYLRLPPVCCAPQPTDPMTLSLEDFRVGCTTAARRANGGGDLAMDDATEEKIAAYCGCVADSLKDNVAPGEIAKIADDTASDTTRQLLARIVSGCQAKLQ